MTNISESSGGQLSYTQTLAKLDRRQFVASSLAGVATTAFSLTAARQAIANPTSAKPRRIFIDSDAKNEIDDQYAIVRALIAPELRVEGITAAGFHDRKSGAQRSYDEIERILKLTGLTNKIPAALGSSIPMKDKQTPRPTDATRLIIERALADDPDPLYVLALGQFTNLASALLIEPKIKDRVVYACIDGDYKHGNTPAWGPGIYNWKLDVPAVQAIFESDVRYIHMPARSVSGKMYITRDEVAEHLRDRGPVYDFLVSLWNEGKFRKLKGKILWDIALVHVMIDPSHGERVTVPAPIVNNDGTTQDDPTNERKVDVYADINAAEIYRSFWKAADAQSFS